MWWIDVCGSVGRRLHKQLELRPADVERGLFYLVDSDRCEDAEAILCVELSFAPRPVGGCFRGKKLFARMTRPYQTLWQRPSACDDGSEGTRMQKEYVTKVEGAYRVAGTRVSLDSLVYLFREGISAEGMVESYPALTLEEVHGALAFYLANQKEINAYLVEGQRAAESQHEQSRQTNAELIAKLHRARNASQIPS